MRIDIDPACGKNLAKRLVKISDTHPLSMVRESIAKAAGYQSWYEVTRNLASKPADSGDVSNFVLRLADALGLLDGDVLFAVAKSRLWPEVTAKRPEYEWIRLTALRTRFGAPKRGAAGSIVRVRTSGGTEYGYALAWGRPTYVMYERGPGICADFEAVVPRKPVQDFVPARLHIPYGRWTLRDGSEVLFSRDYLPLWRVSSGVVERVDPWLWIPHVREEHFFKLVGTRAWSHGPAKDYALDYLTRSRVVGLPRLFEVLPFMAGPTNSVSQGVTRLFHHLGTPQAAPDYGSVAHAFASS